MSLDTSKPITWTSKGNLNTDELTYFSRFEFPESGATVHVWGYQLKSTGEVVQQNAAVLASGVEAFIATGAMS